MDKKGRLSLIILVIVLLITIAGAITYFAYNKYSKNNLLKLDTCVYNSEKEITCGTAFVLVLEGVEYPLVANEAFYFPLGENKLIGLVDQSKPEGKRAFLLFLEEGEHTINEETSRRAVGSFIAR